MNTSKKQSEGRKAGGSGIPRLKSVLIALTLGLLLAPPVSCQQMIWQAFNDSGSKFYDEHDYERAEKSLLNAVKEAEKLSKDGPELVASLKLLRKVYLALDKQALAAQVAERLSTLGASESAGETSTGTSGEVSTRSENAAPKADTASRPADNPSSARTEAASKSENADVAPALDGSVDSGDKTLRRDGGSAAPSNSASSSAPATSVAGSGTASAPVIASSRGIDGELRVGQGVKKAVELLKLSGHISWEKSVAISSDGLRAISGSDDDTVRLWDLQTGKELKRFDGHDDNVNSVVFSPAANTALSGSTDKTVRLWDLETGACLKSLKGTAT